MQKNHEWTIEVVADIMNFCDLNEINFFSEVLSNALTQRQSFSDERFSDIVASTGWLFCTHPAGDLISEPSIIAEAHERTLCPERRDHQAART